MVPERTLNIVSIYITTTYVVNNGLYTLLNYLPLWQYSFSQLSQLGSYIPKKSYDSYCYLIRPLWGCLFFSPEISFRYSVIADCPLRSPLFLFTEQSTYIAYL